MSVALATKRSSTVSALSEALRNAGMPFKPSHFTAWTILSSSAHATSRSRKVAQGLGERNMKGVESVQEADQTQANCREIERLRQKRPCLVFCFGRRGPGNTRWCWRRRRIGMCLQTERCAGR